MHVEASPRPCLSDPCRPRHNIFVSALLNPQGLPAQVLLLCVGRQHVELCISADLYAEYEEVTHQPKLKLTPQEINAILQGLREHAIWVKPTSTLHVCIDPDDDMILDCARAANAHYLVTGNIRHSPSSSAAVRIVTAPEFLDTVF